MIEHGTGPNPYSVIVISASRHTAWMPTRTDDGLTVRGLAPYWKVRPVCGMRPLWTWLDPDTGSFELAPHETVGQDPVMALIGGPANDNKGWITMKALIAQTLIAWAIATSTICGLIGWYFAFAPQLGGLKIGDYTIYLPLQYAFWELRPQDAWIQTVGHVLTAAFTALAGYGFSKKMKRVVKPFNEGEMGNAETATKKGLFY